MANCALIDTGYINIAGTGGQASTIVNSGTLVNLNAVSVQYRRSANVDTSEIINSNSGPVAGFGSVTAGRITVQGTLNLNTAADMLAYSYLNAMLASYGVKLFFYTSTTDGVREVTDILGTVNASDVHTANFTANSLNTATPHLHVRVIGFDVTQTASSHMRYTLELVETL